MPSFAISPEGSGPRSDHPVEVVTQRLHGELPEVWKYETWPLRLQRPCPDTSTSFWTFLSADLKCPGSRPRPRLAPGRPTHERRGTRHHREGKVIWAEQLIPSAAAG
jgi:hypothetical protein